MSNPFRPVLESLAKQRGVQASLIVSESDGLIVDASLRFGQDGDLDGALLLLASDAGAYIAGATIVCDGGQMVALRG